ncbi:pentapeptide repeat-containing protein [Asanoa iriomotensis]|uniref:pentapeptide repeat-containing protein n=2 Tax=Asanoa iriomotensis TaxID=234613 RepID=UPI0031D2179A
MGRELARTAGGDRLFGLSAVELRGVRLAGLDLRGSHLDHLKIFEGVVDDCLFDDSSCSDMGVWATSFTNCRFAGADLSSSSFGAWYEGKGNLFQGVDFSRADLRGLATSTARYLGCDFSHARLDGVNFWQSTLVDCTFAGRLRDVVFDGRVLGDEKPDPNPMLNVDLSAAQLDGVNFRKVPFDNVKLPADPDVLPVSSVGKLDSALARVAGRDDVGAKVVRSRFGRMKLTLESGEPQVLINVRDLRRTSPQAESLARELLGISTH